MNEIELLQAELARYKSTIADLTATVEKYKKSFTDSETARLALEEGAKKHKDEVDTLTNRLSIYEAILPHTTIQNHEVSTKPNQIEDLIDTILSPEEKGENK